MMRPFRLFAPALIALATLAAPGAVSAQSFTDTQKSDIEAIVKNYLVSHPEVLEEAMNALSKRQADDEKKKQQASIAKNASTIFNSPRGVVLGNKDGDVTFVEFFDYNCGYCKRAMADMLDLIKTDPKLKVVLKEFPVLSEGSVEAAKVAVAARMQDPSKYLDFHTKLLGGRGPADKARAMAVAKEAGYDTAKLEKDMQSPEVKATIAENFKLAEDMGMNGTPSYVIGKQVVVEGKDQRRPLRQGDLLRRVIPSHPIKQKAGARAGLFVWAISFIVHLKTKIGEPESARNISYLLQLVARAMRKHSEEEIKYDQSFHGFGSGAGADCRH
jgi:protein-disulfide isomerase